MSLVLERLTQKYDLNQQQLTGVKPLACLACANGVTLAGNLK